MAILAPYGFEETHTDDWVGVAGDMNIYTHMHACTNLVILQLLLPSSVYW